ncbi:histidinol phosphate phosphatase domain-containing protein [bacterium]|nr:histidinol phosphate phosphatase domain-containing protein [bacterium]MBU1614548.1 histidinol phosphate phosphatase domain-containing protein [bacterium]
MIDLHTHSLFSDGELLPSELVRRAKVIGCQAIAITDHADSSNLDFVLPRMVKVCEDLNREGEILVIPGIELTHVPPSALPDLVKEARRLGAKIVVVHGETIVEPVAPGTNKEALLCDIDILAHPGLLTKEEAQLAGERDIFLEITTRRGHSLTNGHVAKLAKEAGANLVLNTDAHSPEDLISDQMREKIALGAGLTPSDVKRLEENARKLVEKARC